MTKPAYAPWPVFDREIVSAVTGILKSGRTNQWVGKHVYAFEKEYAAHLGVKHAVAMFNGTVTLDVALKVLGVGPGDEVVVTSRSFVASASCAAATGAATVFADVDPRSGNITAGAIEAVLTRRTKAVIVVHLAGWPCDMDPIMKLCRSRGVKVIEDCAQAHGARYKGKAVGSFGDFASFSFCQEKIIATGGEGGLLATNDAALWRKAWSLKDHGRDPALVMAANTGTGFRWIVDRFGSNYRMTEYQAAIGRIQLKRLGAMVRARRANAAVYDAAFARVPGLIVDRPPKGFEHAYYKYYVRVDLGRLKPGWSRDRIVARLSARGVPCGGGACPEIYREKAFRDRRRAAGLSPEKVKPAAAALGRETIMLVAHPTLSRASVKRIAREVADVMKDAVR